jgi:glycine cleavage system transcriptional repressor
VPQVSVTAVGADRPGIVAAVAKVFVDHGCNIEDSSMTILRGRFAMMLVVDVPAGVGPDDLEAALAAPASAFDLVVAVRPLATVANGGDDDVGEGSRWTLSVHGADRPGIVHAVSDLLAAHGVNIVDLTTRVIGEPERPVYAMLLEVVVPLGVDAGALDHRLQAVAAALGIQATLHPSDADIL